MVLSFFALHHRRLFFSLYQSVFSGFGLRGRDVHVAQIFVSLNITAVLFGKATHWTDTYGSTTYDWLR